MICGLRRLNFQIKINKATKIITAIAGIGGLYVYNGDNIKATDAVLHYPLDVFVDSFGDFYIADFYNFLIRKVNVATGIITRIAGNIYDYGFSGDDGPATSASIGLINSLTLDKIEESHDVEEINLQIEELKLNFKQLERIYDCVKYIAKDFENIIKFIQLQEG